MKKSSRLAQLFVLTILLSCGGISTAQADGLYFGGGVYASYAETDDLRETDETTGFQVGYLLLDSNVFMFALELGAYDLGEYSENNVEVEADAISLSAVGTLPLGPFIELYGKIGVAEVEVDINDRSHDGTEAMYGAGLAFDFFDTVDIYLEYLEFDTEVDSSMVGAGLRFDLF